MNFVLFIFGFALSFLVGRASNLCDINLGVHEKKDLQIGLYCPKSLGNTELESEKNCKWQCLQIILVNSVCIDSILILFF